MLTPNPQLRATALNVLDKKWMPAVLVTLVYMVITGIFAGPTQMDSMHRMQAIMSGNLAYPLSNWSNLWFIVGCIFVVNVLLYGLMTLFLEAVRTNTEPKIEALFTGFSNNYSKIMGTMLLMNVYTALWSLLLIVPGIIKCYSYALTPYLLRDEPELGADATITKSMAMMQGNKMKLFCLDLSFIGWGILAVLTFGIGLLWLVPYMHSTRAAFYLDIKQAQQEQQA